jgi:hypothetical protein
MTTILQHHYQGHGLGTSPRRSQESLSLELMQLTSERVDRSDVVPAKSEPSPKGDFPLEIIALLAKTRHGPDKKAPLTKTIALTFFGLG